MLHSPVSRCRAQVSPEARQHCNRLCVASPSRRHDGVYPAGAGYVGFEQAETTCRQVNCVDEQNDTDRTRLPVFGGIVQVGSEAHQCYNRLCVTAAGRSHDNIDPADDTRASRCCTSDEAEPLAAANARETRYWHVATREIYSAHPSTLLSISICNLPWSRPSQCRAHYSMGNPACWRGAGVMPAPHSALATSVPLDCPLRS